MEANDTDELRRIVPLIGEIRDNGCVVETQTVELLQIPESMIRDGLQER